MINDASPDAKIPARFAQAPWNERTEFWRQLDAQLPHDHLAREIRNTMVPLDLVPLYQTYSGRGKAPHRPDLMLAIVLFELRRGLRSTAGRGPARGVHSRGPQHAARGVPRH